MAEYALRKRYDNHKGLDLKSTDLTRPLEFSPDMRNAQYRKNGSIEKRPGYQAHCSDSGGYGLFEYKKYDTTTGKQSSELITVDNNLWRINKVTATVVYSGADPSCSFDLFYDPNAGEYKCQILEGSTIVLDESLGIGFDEASPYDLADLKTAIDAVANFACTISGDDTVPAAFIKTTISHDLVASDAVLFARATEQVNSTSSNPLSTFFAERNDDNFENASFIQISNCVYVGTGHDHTMKYDGQTFYRAGLPDVENLTSALGGAGAITGTNYLHKARYIQYDAAGNIIEGNVKSTDAVLNPVAQSMDVTVDNIQAGSGFNTNCAIVAGNQVGVNTITVDDGSGGSHTMQVGDTAYFFDGVSADYVQREVTAVASTTITIAGAAVDVDDNDVISNNLRIGLYRNESAGSVPLVFYLLEEIPNNSFAASQVYNDNFIDSNLGELLVEPSTDRSPPPKGKYLSQYNGQMLLAGNMDFPNYLYYSDIDHPEYFPSDSNIIDADNSAGDIITGVFQNTSGFYIMKSGSVGWVTGDLSQGAIRLDWRSLNIGCSSHASIQEVDSRIYWWAPEGPVWSSGGSYPLPIGLNKDGAGRLEPVTDQSGVVPDLRLNFKKSVGFNFNTAKKWIVFIPNEDTIGGEVVGTSSSVAYVYDYTRDSWLKWTNMNMMGGICSSGEELFWLERRYSSFVGTAQAIFYRQHNNGNAYDYQDNSEPVDFSYSSQWDSLGEPSVLKQPLEIKVFALDEVEANDFNLTIQQETNFVKDFAVAEFDISAFSGGYGFSAFGEAPYGDSGEPIARHSLNRDRSRAVRFIFINNEDQVNSVLTGWEIEFAAPFRKEFKR